MVLITRRAAASGLVALPLAQLPSVDRKASPALVIRPLIPSEETFVIGAKVNGANFVFLIDTGASVSCVFEESIPKLGRGTEVVPNRRVVVRGLAETAERPVVVIDEIAMGTASHRNTAAVVLPRRRIGYQIDGVMGMDILRYYAMLYDPEAAQITLTPTEDFRRGVVRGWDEVRLHPNPFGGPDYGLHFGDARINRHDVPVLIDTGTAPSLMNWEAATFNRTLRRFRETERRRWEVEGATGKFSPVVMAEMPPIRFGEHEWRNANLLIADFEPINVLGFEGRPLIICGADMLGSRRWVIDFEEDRLFFDPRIQPTERNSADIRRGAAASDPY